MDKKNVIDITGRLKSSKKSKGTAASSTPAAVLDMTERREAALTAERRSVKRTILTEFIGGFAVIPQQGLQKISIYDISESGLAFDLKLNEGQFRVGEEVAVRIYFSQTSYIPVSVKVANIRSIEDEGVVRFGANFVTGSFNQDAMYHLVKFVEKVGTSLHTDKGDLVVSSRR